MPINHSTKSVTVIEESAMLADGWATAFLAMGSAQGLEIAEKEKIAVIFIDKSEKKLIKITSNEFKKLK
jgi:thiamine biosynthesis lipoprotein